MDNIKIKKLLLIICSILIVSTGVIGLTLSAFTSTDQVVNKLEVGDVNIKNIETFDSTPDGNIEKEVQIQNITVKTPALVRVNITPRWVEIKDGKEIPWSGDASNRVVTLNFSSNNVVEYSNDFDPDDEDWMHKWMIGRYEYDEEDKEDKEDGYYYYTSMLKSGDLTSTILESVKINLPQNSDEYQGKILIVDVNSEAVQPTKQAYIDAWGTIPPNITKMLDELLGIESDSENI